ncbi:hypothetical protein D3C72_1739760 [compost metagenome]
MGGPRGIPIEADMNLPGEKHQLLAVRIADARHCHQQLPAHFLRTAHAEIRTGLAVADQLAVVAACFRHPEAPLVHGAGQDHRADNHGKNHD